MVPLGRCLIRHPTARHVNSRHLLNETLDRLGVEPDDLVYLHSSYSRIRHFGLTPAGILATFVEHLGPQGTLVLPSFAWHLDPRSRPWAGYAQYCQRKPLFDVRSTPSNIGVVPETFRGWPGVRRSANYFWSVVALGPLAEHLTDRQDEVVFPHGPDSCFGLMRALGVKIVGLGVTLNTSSLAPVVDHELSETHRRRVLTSTPEAGAVVGYDGRVRITSSYWLLPDVVRWIKPAVFIDETPALMRDIRRLDHGQTIQFCYRFSSYCSSALTTGAACLVEGREVPWLRELAAARNS